MSQERHLFSYPSAQQETVRNYVTASAGVIETYKVPPALSSAVMQERSYTECYCSVRQRNEIRDLFYDLKLPLCIELESVDNDILKTCRRNIALKIQSTVIQSELTTNY